MHLVKYFQVIKLWYLKTEIKNIHQKKSRPAKRFHVNWVVVSNQVGLQELCWLVPKCSAAFALCWKWKFCAVWGYWVCLGRIQIGIMW